MSPVDVGLVLLVLVGFVVLALWASGRAEIPDDEEPTMNTRNRER